MNQLPDWLIIFKYIRCLISSSCRQYRFCNRLVQKRVSGIVTLHLQLMIDCGRSRHKHLVLLLLLRRLSELFLYAKALRSAHGMSNCRCPLHYILSAPFASPLQRITVIKSFSNLLAPAGAASQCPPSINIHSHDETDLGQKFPVQYLPARLYSNWSSEATSSSP
jgi:hypothetical protein